MCFTPIKLEDISDLISILSPIILLIWFYYSQKQVLSKNYYGHINGIYSGFVQPTIVGNLTDLSAGIILNIRDTDENGHFKGEFDYAERNSSQILIRSINTFMGKMEFELYTDKNRNPFDLKDNRVYKGKMFIVDRLDYEFENYKIDDYMRAEYEITHYRELQVMKFKLLKTRASESIGLPSIFTLYRKIGFSFDPYNSVKVTIFDSQTNVDVVTKE